GTGGSCYQEPKQGVTHGSKSGNRPLNLESNKESNFEERARDVENLIRATAKSLSQAGKTKAAVAPSVPRTASDQGVAAASDHPDAPRLPLELPGGGE
ncbi:MAG: replication protein, partial [Candidatus Competibacteraceae bacterium]|nr:replication protein [Candidatus Competibacteraceae bacterium]